MGANVPIWCRVLVTHEEWREVYALGRADAEYEVSRQAGVIAVLETSYEPPAESEEGSL